MVVAWKRPIEINDSFAVFETPWVKTRQERCESWLSSPVDVGPKRRRHCLCTVSVKGTERGLQGLRRLSREGDRFNLVDARAFIRRLAFGAMWQVRVTKK